MSKDRRHAAIMFTDIVGYTALMGSNEDMAFEILHKNREIHTKYIQQFNGTLIKEMGDGMLISFDLASDAVRCAIEIQRACKPALQAGILQASESNGIPLKIGIHEGEMVFEGNDVLGDGVNIASRIQDGTEEGCIMISGSVYRDIKNKADIQTEFVGERQFKNVDEPIKIYKVFCEGKERQHLSKASNQKYPDRKSIIVLPFVNISSDPEQEYFSDGMTEEIITDLSHIHNLLVISRSSAMTFKGSKLNIKEIAKKVNVKYVLEGSVRKAGNKLRITAQLIDANRDTHLWAEKYIGVLDDVFDIQEKVSRSIVDALKFKLSAEEKLSIEERPIRDVKAYEYYLKARQEIDTFTEEGIKRAIQYLESALKIVGENDVLYAGLAYAWWQYFNIGSKQEYLDNGLKYAGEALCLNSGSSEGHFVTGNLYIFSVLGKIKKGIYHLRQAIKADPNNCEALFHLGGIYLSLGKTAEATPLIDYQISIDPLNFYGYWLSSIYHLFEGRTKQAVKSMINAHELAPGIPSIDFFYALVLIYNGNLDEAFSIIEESEKTNPNNIFTQLGVFMKYSSQGKKDEAMQSVTSQVLDWSSNDLTNPWYIVAGYSLIGEKDEALKWLEKWINLGFINYPFLNKYNTLLKNIRSEERFKKLMEKVKRKWENFEV